jgi:DNA (cytosine-5)-methyltransferase 3A
LNVLSLFDGISTGYYCLKKAGVNVKKYFASEINPNAIKISEKNYPDVIRLGDICTVDSLMLPRIDLIIGGSPCQGFSRAGKNLNFDDPRSKLFFEYLRIFNDIRNYNPDVKFLLENVVMNKDCENRISDYMGVEPVKIDSRDFSAQHRERLYWTNIPILQYEKRTVKLTDILDDSHTVENLVLYKGVYFDSGTSENGRRLVERINGEVRIKQATKLGYIVAEDGDGVSLEFPTSKSRRGRVIKNKSHTLTTSGRPQVFHNNTIRLLNTLERERLQTLPDDYTKCEGVTDSARNEALGNGWTADVITHIFKGLTVSDDWIVVFRNPDSDNRT